MSELEIRYFEDDNETAEKASLHRVDAVERGVFHVALQDIVEIADEPDEAEQQDDEPPEQLHVPLSVDPIRDYLRIIGKHNLVNAEQEVALSKAIEVGVFATERRMQLMEQGTIENSIEIRELKQLEHTGERAREQMINANLRLVVNIAKRYHQASLTMLDLIQEGNVGLIRAVEKFDYKKGFKFSTYATWWIRQGITRAIADTSTEIRVPVHMHERITKMESIERDLLKKGREATNEQIAVEMGESVEKIKLYKDYSRIRRPRSYNAKLSDDNEDEFGDLIEDGDAPDPEVAAEVTDLHEQIIKIIHGLEEREAMIIRMRFGLEGSERYTLDFIAAQLDVTRERVRQIETKVITKLHDRHKTDTGLREYL
ncbi:MAG TPA: sigma-70 family RNA polymerase sigma factor [Candidatus Microsaccharimonas sp.]|jgi:RNA polymerase primary sigma factor